VTQEVKGSTLIAAALQLPSEAWPFEQLTTVISLFVMGRLLTRHGGA